LGSPKAVDVYLDNSPRFDTCMEEPRFHST